MQLQMFKCCYYLPIDINAFKIHCYAATGGGERFIFFCFLFPGYIVFKIYGYMLPVFVSGRGDFNRVFCFITHIKQVIVYHVFFPSFIFISGIISRYKTSKSVSLFYLSCIRALAAREYLYYFCAGWLSIISFNSLNKASFSALYPVLCSTNKTYLFLLHPVQFTQC